MPCATVFAPVSMLLAVLLAVVPLILPPSSAGGAVLQHATTVQGVTGPEPNRILHLRQADLPLAAVPARVAPTNVSENAAPDVQRRSASAPSSRTVPVTRAETAIASRGSSPITGARTAPAPVQTPRTSGVRSDGARFRLIWPSQGTLSSPFGWRIHPIFGTREFHTGVDIAAQSGTPVVAADSGIVRFVGWQEGYGQRVVVEHGGGLATAYSHLSVAAVQPQDRVTQGQEIGRIGSTGWSTGPHLLFEVYQNGVPQNPVGYLP